MTNHLSLFRLRETSQIRTLRFKNGMADHLRPSLGKGLQDCPASPSFECLLTSVLFPHCVHSTVLVQCLLCARPTARHLESPRKGQTQPWLSLNLEMAQLFNAQVGSLLLDLPLWGLWGWLWKAFLPVRAVSNTLCQLTVGT